MPISTPIVRDAQILLWMVKDIDVAYNVFLETTSVCTFVANKSHRSTRQYFYIFDSLPIVNSNKIFDKMTFKVVRNKRSNFFLIVIW